MLNFGTAYNKENISAPIKKTSKSQKEIMKIDISCNMTVPRLSPDFDSPIWSSG